jgi:hypothetical protein
MAQRPVFLSIIDGKSLVRDIPIEFKWHAGMAASQKQKSIRSLHEAATKRIQTEEILEISSKSELELGRQLSAFMLSFDLDSGTRTTVECAFQGSKVFQKGGPYCDLYGTNSRAAKKDHRIQESGSLIAFSLEGEEWPLDPQTYFYDWIYINALHQNPSMVTNIVKYDAFTDIEFNPVKSINCQARSVAQYVAMYRRGILEKTLNDKNLFLSHYQGANKTGVQQQLL